MSSFNDDIRSLQEGRSADEADDAVLPSSRTSTLKIVIVSLVVIGVIAVIAVLVVLLLRSRNSEPTPAPTFTPSLKPTFSPTEIESSKPSSSPSSSPVTLQPIIIEPSSSTKTVTPTFYQTTSFQLEVETAITDLYHDIPSPLLDKSSSQSKALTWMTYNNEILPETLQRYYIGVLYFALEGNTWNNKKNWMIDNVTECDWYGIECNNDSIVVKISLGSNGVRGTIPREFALLDTLDTLKMENNQIGGLLPSSIGLMTKLSFLSVFSNKLEGLIPSDIGNLTTMRNLYLDHNAFRSTIPIEFWNMDELVDLTLGNNYLEGTIHKNIGQLTSLERLWINDNSFSGSLPDFNYAMLLKPNMKFLYIDSNKFDGTISDDFTSFMPNLRDIRFSNNYLEGCIPKTLFDMKSLETLYLDHNRFSCELFPEIYRGPQLVDLQIQVNRLRGSIPEDDRPSGLVTLDLSKNIISSTIPANLRFLNSTKLLSFSYNNIYGTIPNNFGDSLGQLEYLRLSNNKLSGTISSDLGELRNMKELLLEYNRLDGSMPEEVCRRQNKNSAIISADCFGTSPLISCSCCSNCEDAAPSRQDYA